MYMLQNTEFVKKRLNFLVLIAAVVNKIHKERDKLENSLTVFFIICDEKMAHLQTLSFVLPELVLR